AGCWRWLVRGLQPASLGGELRGEGAEPLRVHRQLVRRRDDLRRAGVALRHRAAGATGRAPVAFHGAAGVPRADLRAPTAARPKPGASKTAGVTVPLLRTG